MKLHLRPPGVLADQGLFYLASPYSASPHGKDMAFQMACRAAACLLKAGVKVFSPIAHSHPLTEPACGDILADEPHEFWMDLDQEFVERSDGLIVAAQPGWRESKGVQMEIAWAEELELPIWTLIAATVLDTGKHIGVLVDGLLPEEADGLFVFPSLPAGWSC